MNREEAALSAAHNEVKTELARTDTKASLLLVTVRPNLGGGGGFPKWAALTPDRLRAHLSADRLPHDIGVLARIAVGKFTRLRHAIHLTVLAGGVLVCAAGIALGGVA